MIDAQAETLGALKQRLMALGWDIVTEHQAAFYEDDAVTEMLYHLQLAAKSGDLEGYNYQEENLRGYLENGE